MVKDLRRDGTQTSMKAALGYKQLQRKCIMELDLQDLLVNRVWG